MVKPVNADTLSSLSQALTVDSEELLAFAEELPFEAQIRVKIAASRMKEAAAVLDKALAFLPAPARAVFP